MTVFFEKAFIALTTRTTSVKSNKLNISRLGTCTIATLIAVLALSVPADAKKKKQPEMVPCTIDTPLRVADAKQAAALKVLEGCTGQLIETPPDPPRELMDTIEIKGGDETSNYSDMDTQRPKRNKSIRAGGQSANEPASQYILTSAGGVRSVRIIPDAQEQNYALGAQNSNAAVSKGSSRTIKDNPEAILSLRPGLYTTRFDNLIETVARRHRIDPLFLHAVIKQESGYRPGIGSHAGAVGLMQIMPATGRGLGLHPAQRTDPVANVDAGARLLRKLHKRYNGDFSLVLAAYNAGEGAVQKYGNRVPPYRETQHYVKAILANYEKLVATARSNGSVSAQ